MLNTEVAKVLIVSKNQFKVFQYKIPSIELNIIYTNKTIICFESKTFLSFINTIQINILVDIANFYVIDTFTPFFLYLKDINIFNIYLNNITNQLIHQDNKSVFIIHK